MRSRMKCLVAAGCVAAAARGHRRVRRPRARPPATPRRRPTGDRKVGIATPAKTERLRLEPAGRRRAPQAAATAPAPSSQAADGIGYDNTDAVLRAARAERQPSLIIAHASGYDTIAAASRSSTRCR